MVRCNRCLEDDRRGYWSRRKAQLLHRCHKKSVFGNCVKVVSLVLRLVYLYIVRLWRKSPVRYSVTNYTLPRFYCRKCKKYVQEKDVITSAKMDSEGGPITEWGVYAESSVYCHGEWILHQIGLVALIVDEPCHVDLWEEKGSPNV